MEDKKYWLWLFSIPGIGNKRFMQLKRSFKNLEGVWNATKGELIDILGLNDIADRIIDKRYKDSIEQYIEKLNAFNIKVITYEDNEYPYLLKNIHEPPQLLFLKGSTDVLKMPCIAIVGSRKATDYGLEMARKFASELASRGIVIVSGMARGIDTSAHLGAMEAGGKTIAVMGCGLNYYYPPENKRIIEKTAEHGAAISEYGFGVKPNPGHFPARNRIISGLSLGTVVIEAGEKSGSLITADLALEQGREVFAIPGNVDSFSSKGANTLIKQGAKLVTSINDILEEFEHLIINKEEIIEKKVEQKIPSGLSQEEESIIKFIGGGETHIDVIGKKMGYTLNQLNSLLIMLELKGLVSQHPGKFYSRA